MNTQNLYDSRATTPFIAAAIALSTLCAVAFLITLFNSLEGAIRIQLVSLAALLIVLISAVIYYVVWSAQTSIKDMKGLIERKSSVDELTAVYSRHWFLNRYQEESDRAKRYNHNLAVIMVDIDHFNELNRSRGTAAGDVALQTLAELLRTGCRTSDLIARYGSDSFVVLIPEADTAGTLVLAEKLRNNVAATTIHLENTPEATAPLHFTVSLGMACIDKSILGNSKECPDLLAQADAALYRAKHVGRNRVMVTPQSEGMYQS